MNPFSDLKNNRGGPPVAPNDGPTPTVSGLVPVRRVHSVFSTARFKGGGEPWPKTRETAALKHFRQLDVCSGAPFIILPRTLKISDPLVRAGLKEDC